MAIEFSYDSDAFWLILLAGLLGGTVNWLRGIEHALDSEEDEKKNVPMPSWKRFGINFGLSVIAAFMVPLFLTLSQSNIMKDAVDTAGFDDLFIFFGFCLVAAISPSVFINSVSRQANKAAQAAQKEAAQAQANFEEDELPDIALSSKETESLTEVRIAVMKAFDHKPNIKRSVSGIYNELHHHPHIHKQSDIASIIMDLLELDFVVAFPATNGDGQRYKLTPKGQIALNR